MISHTLTDLARATGLPVLKRAAGAVTRLVPIPQPLLMVGPGAAERLAAAIGDFGHRRLLVVTDAMIVRLGLLAPVTAALERGGTAFDVFDEIEPDAPIPVVERGLLALRRQRCDAVLAVGGGSVIDAAKVIALAATNAKALRDLAGYFRGLHGPLPVYAVPTTAGTGSEVTVAAVISDPDAQRKLVVADTRLVPDMAALDPTLMTGLPPAVTAATGMDALTHAIEAYISQWATPATDRLALAAVGMVFEHLPRACEHGDDLYARERMALASTYAGMAFTRANVGNVHAIAHQLGARYHTPHGLANAIVLPHVLRFALEPAAARLAALARRIGVAGDDGDDAAQAARFVDAVQALGDRVGIPRTLAALRDDDIPALAQAACREADLNYPVPRVMSRDDCEALLRQVLPGAAASGARRRAATKSAAARTAAPAKASKSTKATGAAKTAAATKTTPRRTAPPAARRSRTPAAGR
ncbi:iron-containing alcohol dehydrogenase [Azohydromonas sediminis]|uniref:iron-containing alcohol dehydrogenase n=1 Tax=Azohydromonas sediminis TaxID=2259674 RepID=UPI001F416CDD|nr:iron-containing alcohol dehydrogenase [Azohydromonas sediminis]